MYFAELLENCPKLSGIEADLVLIDFYETHYGIFDHFKLGKQFPFAPVALHDSEENSDTSLLKAHFEVFFKTGLNTYMDFETFLKLTHEEVAWVVEIVENMTRRGPNPQKALDELKKAMPQGR